MNRWGVSLLAAGLLVAVSSSTGAHAAGYGQGRDLFSFDDDRIVESSGVVASSVRDDVFFTHNDSGDEPRFFAIDDQGCTVGTYDLAGVDVEPFKATHDVEDIARGPYEGTSSLWLADIGDNLHQRSDIAVFRVDEPQSNESPHRESTGCDGIDAETHVVPTTRYALAYPDVAHDAETLLADPETGQLFIVSKQPTGESQVYAAPMPLDPNAVNVLTFVTEIVYPPSATYDRTPDQLVATAGEQTLFDSTGRVWAVGGDIAPARDRVVIRTYTDAWEWPIAAGQSLADALRAIPTQIRLRYDKQGEAIAYTRDGSSLITTSEGAHSTAHAYDAT